MYLDKRVGKRLVYLSVILTILVANFCINNTGLAIEANGVSNAMDKIVQEYPDGSYFSADGKACFSHYDDQSVGCDNCELIKIHPELTGLVGDSWTCVAFARYIFYEIFGLDAGQYSSNCQEVMLLNAKIGDLVVWPGHQAIYLYSSGDNHYLYESNYRVPNYVKYARANTSAEMASATIWHANNYDNIAGPQITLESISITTLPTKTVYYVGDTFDLSGMIVTGTYSTGDGSYTQEIPSSQYSISGFDSSSPATDQVITVTVDGTTDTFKVQIVSESNDYLYTVASDTGEATITGYVGTGQVVEIPEKIGTHLVTSVVGILANSNPSIRSVVIPKGIKFFNVCAFYNCYNLSQYTVDTENGYYKSEGGVVYNKESDTLLIVPNTLDTINISDTVKTIGDWAFAFNQNISNLNIPDSVTNIGSYAFYKCKKLSQVKLPLGIKRIEVCTFDGCQGLSFIDIPANVESIGEAAFQFSALSSIKLPSGLKNIEGGAFSQSSLNDISLPEGLQTIGGFAFCWTNIDNIVIPESVTSVPDSAFWRCWNLQNIVFKSGATLIDDIHLNQVTIPANTTIIGYVGSPAQAHALTYDLTFIDITPGLSPVLLTADSPNVLVGNTPIEVIVPSAVSTGALTTMPTNGMVILPQIRVVSNKSSLGGIVDISIPNGTVITGGTGWDGIVYLPQNPNSSSIAAIYANSSIASIKGAFDVGLVDQGLSFSQPVRILFSGQGGNSAGWEQNLNFTKIDYLMESDSAEALHEHNDGYLYINNGIDLVIWTTHFTTFVAYTKTPLNGYTLSGQVLVEGDDLTEGQTHYSGGVSIELKQGEEIKYSTTSSEAADLASNGSFSLIGIAAGDYMVVISKAGYLTRSFSLTINSDLTLATISDLYHNRIYLWAGDIVSDEYHVVAASDVNYILSQFNSNSTQAGFDPQVDIVKDQYDVISAMDVNLILSNFNKNSTQYPADITY